MQVGNDETLRTWGNPGVSVIICCYNSSNRITETLKHLCLQKVNNSIAWEVIVVNNASSDNTSDVAAMAWQVNSGDTNFKIVNQPIPGLSFARQKGIEEAKFDIIIFCDDDNWLCDTYVQTAYGIMTRDANIGIAGGWCEAGVEGPISNWMIPFLPALAVGRPANTTSYLAAKGKFVNGAGMIIRKQHYSFIKENGFLSLLDDRKQNTLSSGGDTELCWVMLFAGREIFFDELLFFKHFIPPSRLSKDYLLNLTLSSLYPVIILSIYSFVFQAVPAGFVKFFLKEIILRIYSIFYFTPRMVFGKYPLYCSVVFRQNIKVLQLLISKFSSVKNDFNRIRDLRQRLSKNA